MMDLHSHVILNIQKEAAQKLDDFLFGNCKSICSLLQLILYCKMLNGDFTGAPERTRTSDTRFRKPLLYPAELRAHILQDNLKEFVVCVKIALLSLDMFTLYL